MSSEESQGGKGSEITKKVTGTIENTREFLHDVRVEMKQVTWPSREDVISTTGVVIATVAFFGVFLAIVELDEHADLQGLQDRAAAGGIVVVGEPDHVARREGFPKGIAQQVDGHHIVSNLMSALIVEVVVPVKALSDASPNDAVLPKMPKRSCVFW